LHRRPDALVGTAPADVGHGVVDVLVGRLRFPLQQRRRGHDLPGLAVAALRHVERGPGLLHGMGAGADRPSMVTIRSVAFTPPTGRTQERTSWPLTGTEQAPHCATPQPYLVPVRPTCSRRTHSSGVSASTCTSWTLPLMLSFAMNVLRGSFDRADSPSHRDRAPEPL